MEINVCSLSLDKCYSCLIFWRFLNSAGITGGTRGDFHCGCGPHVIHCVNVSALSAPRCRSSATFFLSLTTVSNYFFILLYLTPGIILQILRECCCYLERCYLCAFKPSPSSELEDDRSSIGLQELIDTLSSCCYRPQRDADGTFVFAVDHCFSVRGHGTVMTGTVVSGSVTVNDVRHFTVLSFPTFPCTSNHVKQVSK